MKKHTVIVRKRTNSVTAKALLISMITVLIGLATASAVLFLWFQKQMQREYRRLTQAALSHIDVTFDYYLENSKSLLTQWFGSPEGTSSRLSSADPLGVNMKLIMDTRNTFEYIPYIQSVYCVNKWRETSFSAGSGISYTADLETLLPVELEKYKNAVNSFCWNVPARYGDGTEIPLLTLCYGEVPIQHPGYTGTALINIDTRVLSEKLFADEQEELNFFIIDRTGRVVAHNNRQYCGEDWFAQTMVQRILSSDEYVFTEKWGGSTWEIIWLESAQKGYYIVAQSEYRSIFQMMENAIRVIVLIMLLAALAMLAILLPTGKVLFNPFQRLVANMRERASFEDSGMDEVQFLKKYYETLSDDIRTLNRKGEKDFIVKNLLMNNRHIEIQKLLLKNRIIETDRGYYQIMAGICESGNENRSLQEYHLLKETVSGIYGSYLGELGNCTYFEVGLRRMLFVVSEADGAPVRPDKIKETLLLADRSAREIAQCGMVTLLSGRTETGNESFVNGFRELESRMTTRFLLDDAGGVGVVEEPPGDEKVGHIMRRILDSLKAKKKEEYESGLNELFTLCKNSPYQYMTGLVLSLSGEIIRIRRKTAPEEIQDARQREELLTQIENIGSHEELMLWFELLYNETVLELQKVGGHSTASQMGSAVDYIDHHYDDSGLNVNLLADRMHISAAYFGKLFKEFAGCTALEYITKVRMEKARELLLTRPELDIGRIAQEVGYGNNAYFTTAFKKYYGVSPSKMRDYHAAGAAVHRMEE